MGFLSWFNFESEKDRKKKAKKYFKKLYPFGEEEQVWEKKIIEELFHYAKKSSRNMYHYELLVLREALIDADHPDEDDEAVNREEVIKKCRDKALSNGVKQEEFDRIFSLAELMLKANSLEEMPSKEDVLHYKI